MKIAVEFYIDDNEKEALDWYANWNNRMTEKMRGVSEGNYLKMTAEDLIPIAVRHYIANEILPEMEIEEKKKKGVIKNDSD